MNNLKSFPGSSQTQQNQLISTNSFSIEFLDSSVQTLIKSWQRRQKWLHYFTHSSLQHLNRAPWRTQLANFLESTQIRVFSIVLLIIDLVITILELSFSLLPCERRKKETEEIIFHWVGIGILCLLSAKTIAVLVGLGSSFFRHPGYVMDGGVVTGALLLETIMERKGGGLLIVVSLWRVIRVVESAFELSDEAIEAQIEGIVCQFEALREDNRRLLEIIDEKDKIIEKLREELDQCRSASLLINSSTL